jgi:hypothetical protein
MPNHRRPYKTTFRGRAEAHTGARRAPDSVKNVLQRATSGPGRIGARAARHQQLREWLVRQLPTELAAQVTGVAAHADELVILAASAAWGVRLRYAVVNLREALERDHPDLSRITVRVAPAER